MFFPSVKGSMSAMFDATATSCCSLVAVFYRRLNFCSTASRKGSLGFFFSEALVYNETLRMVPLPKMPVLSAHLSVNRAPRILPCYVVSYLDSLLSLRRAVQRCKILFSLRQVLG